MSAERNPDQPQTVFDRVWDQPEGHLFKSEHHGVMAVADLFAKLPLQVVVAVNRGRPGEIYRYVDLPIGKKRILNELADAFEEKMKKNLKPGQVSVRHTEGFAVPDHPHIVLFAAERKQGEALYTGSPLGLVAVENTIELMTFSPEESVELERRLDTVAV